MLSPILIMPLAVGLKQSDKLICSTLKFPYILNSKKAPCPLETEFFTSTLNISTSIYFSKYKDPPSFPAAESINEIY